MLIPTIRVTSIACFASSIATSTLYTTVAATTTPTPSSTVASTRCSVNGSTVVTDAAQATSLASACPSFTGTICIDAPGSISLDGITTLEGDLFSNSSSKLSAISSDSITNITGAIYLSHQPHLQLLDLTKLTHAGPITLSNLSSSVGSLDFLHSLEEVAAFDIQRTGLKTLQGPTLHKIGLLNVQHNENLTSVDVQTRNATTIFIGNNSESMSVSLTKLEWVHKLSLAHCLNVALPLLKTVGYTLELAGNTFATFNSTPRLRTISQELWIHDNHNLVNITLPQLQQVGGHVAVHDNPRLTVLDSLSALETVGDYVRVDGSFKQISFPALTKVDGAFDLNSTESLDCTVFNTYYENGIITGSYTCVSSNSSRVYDTSNYKTTTHTTTPSKSLTTGAKAGIGVGVALTSVAVSALAILHLYRKHQLRQDERQIGRSDEQQRLDSGDEGVVSVSEKDIHYAVEMPTDTAIVELPTEKHMGELSLSASSSETEYRHELDGHGSPVEIDSAACVYEMEGDTVQLRKME